MLPCSHGVVVNTIVLGSPFFVYLNGTVLRFNHTIHGKGHFFGESGHPGEIGTSPSVGFLFICPIRTKRHACDGRCNVVLFCLKIDSVFFTIRGTADGSAIESGSSFSTTNLCLGIAHRHDIGLSYHADFSGPVHRFQRANESVRPSNSVFLPSWRDGVASRCITRSRTDGRRCNWHRTVE